MRDRPRLRYMPTAMAQTPIPIRIQPLAWRAPVFFWLPFSLAVAISWPAALFSDEQARAPILAAGAMTFALALAALGAGWIAGRAPKERRIVVLHVVVAGAATALLSPWLAPTLSGASLDSAMLFSFAPLALLLGLPAALVSGVVFAWLALAKGAPAAPRAAPAPPQQSEAPPRLRSSSEL